MFDSIPDWYNFRETCDIFFPEDTFLIVICSNKYITHRMCDEALNDSLKALRLMPDRFVTSKIIDKLFTTLSAGEHILYCNLRSPDVIYS